VGSLQIRIRGGIFDMLISKVDYNLLSDVMRLKDAVKQSVDGVMEGALTASHLASDVYTLLNELDKLEQQWRATPPTEEAMQAAPSAEAAQPAAAPAAEQAPPAAQETPPAEEAPPAEETPPAEEAPAEEAPEDTGEPTEEDVPPEDEGPIEGPETEGQQ
jgi:chemotaxis protein histidine kinase CheA